eukprot:364568-Chlamydomonas_euryale.AAC.14
MHSADRPLQACHGARTSTARSSRGFTTWARCAGGGMRRPDSGCRAASTRAARRTHADTPPLTPMHCRATGAASRACSCRQARSRDHGDRPARPDPPTRNRIPDPTPATDGRDAARLPQVANASGVACPEVLSASQWLHQAPLALFRPRAGVWRACTGAMGAGAVETCFPSQPHDDPGGCAALLPLLHRFAHVECLSELLKGGTLRYIISNTRCCPMIGAQGCPPSPLRCAGPV